ncbi:undecaprenyldiphospho-muramoylpentapeptide beta-N-acetylglucosaminyltransferase [Parvibaculum sp.]|uniref:undecaprenyldiphospho-muramoylpentapeptide beta-N-acetylglucosaminyltransferase n=1 Tax=Parvibaculum sp. TaxID=2024848 RepID=UPI00272F2EA1|nr:undecaprenyldiphospho-muramoylpentapeptide beta-N-acetylglucosaminyltransferase [Parvibaculum sp.]MDP1626974.1 undecaprenyldiphospho-muramoylpentapeptide beta-N-acetylglucosaminyltransferase [Parvibaculum sp.]MDP2151630.1 undecaprenyldiphospho-muramoylpentapeptide beta-N-acetylglucosaminyltransferase [Parvibaculum sp.]MDP3328784.1 undecaprenyldiphospho-muramoylpentapeptide beta-N-acetylglucosaminyltransferase [Parvibaculum sp.]
MTHYPNGPIVIAAGGTGGHLFPGQALAQELRRRGRRIVLMTDERVQRFDKLFPDADIYAVPSATPSGKGIVGLLRAAPAILAGVARSFSILQRVKPAALIGFGGYPTLPPVLAAILRGVPACVHEQNAVLGRVNRLVGPHVEAIASTFDAPKFLKARDAGKLVLTGNPVRDAVIAQAGAPYETPRGEDRIKLLVFGGSQGARVMSDIVPVALAQLPEHLRRRLAVVQQCRAEDIERVGDIYKEAGIDAELSDFFDDMPERIAACHLVIGRSGASTVSELAVIGRPSILVPLPHSLDNDQKANAEKLAQAGAAWMIEQKYFTADALRRQLEQLFGNPSDLEAAAAAARRQGQPNAVRDLADLVEALGRGEYRALRSRRNGGNGNGGDDKLLKFATGGA